MKKILSLCTIGSAALFIAVAAAPEIPFVQEGDYTYLDPETLETVTVTRHAEPVIPSEVSAGNVKVVFKAKFDKKIYKQHSLNYAFRHDQSKNTAYRIYGNLSFKDSTVTFSSLAPGLYDFMIEFLKGTEDHCFVAVEDVMLTKDTIIEVNPEVCTNTITTRPMMPDGKEMEWYTLDVAARDTISFGNMPYGYGYGVVVHSMAVDPAFTHTIELYHKILADNTEVDSWHDAVTWHFNESKRFKPMYMIQGVTPKYGTLLAVAIGDSVQSQVLTNNPADFMKTFEYTVPDYKLTPYETQGLPTRINNVELHYLYNGIKGGGIGMISGNVPQLYTGTRLTMGLPTTVQKWTDNVQFCPEPGKIFIYTGENGNFGIFPPTIQQPDQYRDLVLSPREPASFTSRSLLLAPYGPAVAGGSLKWNVNPTFSFKAEDYPEIEFGVNPTVNYIGFSDDKCDVLPIGLYGETQTVDLVHNESFLISFNDAALCDYYPALATAFKSIAKKEVNKGAWKLNLVTRNAKADNIEGTNTTETVWDTSKDSYAPSLRILQFRNAEGKITNRGQDGDDLKMMFAANTYVYQSTKYMAMTKAENIKVEYAPHGSDVFTELKHTECPELYFSPSIGNVYTVDLNQINRKSDTYWYDLRFTLDNGKGAYQKQIVSPAFRLDRLSGVVAVSNDMDVYVSGRDIVAPEGTRVYTLAGIETRHTSLTPGIYLVHTGEKTIKVVIK